LNAGVALYLYGLHSTLDECISHAKENLLNHSALALLKNWRAFSHENQ
jgi:anthranilate phosphoribosyltransferase